MPRFQCGWGVKAAENVLGNSGEFCVCILDLFRRNCVWGKSSAEAMGVSSLECLLIRTGLQNMLLRLLELLAFILSIAVEIRFLEDYEVLV